MPCPERIEAGFKLTPIGFFSFSSSRLFRSGLLDQFLRNLPRQVQHLRAGHLQNKTPLLVHELINHSPVRCIPLHFDFILRNWSRGKFSRSWLVFRI